MKIVYSAPNKSHHYPYALAINKQQSLLTFITSFSRFSPLASLPELDGKLVRFDLVKNLHLVAYKFRFPEFVTSNLDLLAGFYLDSKSYHFAKNADVFIYYRTEGFRSTKRIHKENRKTLCVLEEVNSHVQYQNEILLEELRRLKLHHRFKERIHDFDLRLKSYDEADCILCPSTFVYNSFVSKGIDENKLIKVNFGFSNNLYKPNYVKTKNDQTFRVLYVGQIHYRKGLRYAIEAFKQLNCKKKEFVIVGAKTKITGLENLIIPKEVIFKGVLKGEELEYEYRNASVFVLPSIEEGLALVQGEALSYGLPILITPNTGGADLITEGEEGYILECGNISQLSDKFQYLADNPHVLSLMSSKAIDLSRKIGNWDYAVQTLIEKLGEKIKLFK